VHIVAEATGISAQQAKKALEDADFNIKTAIVMVQGECDLETAQDLLAQAEGVVGKALQIMEQESENK